ncbi:MAG: hypothetical protein ACHP7N_00340 [Caulobacterales bacterium]
MTTLSALERMIDETPDLAGWAPLFDYPNEAEEIRYLGPESGRRLEPEDHWGESGKFAISWIRIAARYPGDPEWQEFPGAIPLGRPGNMAGGRAELRNGRRLMHRLAGYAGFQLASPPAGDPFRWAADPKLTGEFAKKSAPVALEVCSLYEEIASDSQVDLRRLDRLVDLQFKLGMMWGAHVERFSRRAGREPPAWWRSALGYFVEQLGTDAKLELIELRLPHADREPPAAERAMLHALLLEALETPGSPKATAPQQSRNKLLAELYSKRDQHQAPYPGGRHLSEKLTDWLDYGFLRRPPAWPKKRKKNPPS